MSVLTEADRALLPLALRAQGGYHLATEWYCRGWTPLGYQWAFHHIPQLNTTFLAGIASGKTTAVAASFLIDCLSIPYFKALNTSISATQAELAFEMFMSWYEENDHLAHLVKDVKLRPYPRIEFQNFSEWTFRTAGLGARLIRGKEYDRINYDEAGYDDDEEAITTLRGRLRGTRPDGSKRMSRLDTTTTPTAAEWLERRFNRGLKGHPDAELGMYRSLRVTTYDNTHLTKQQIALMEAEYSDDLIEVEMKAQFPDFGLSMFPIGHVRACTDRALNDQAYLALHPEDELARPVPGWALEEHPRHGIFKWEMPFDPRRVYVLAGDPGTDNPPKRNSAAVGVLDVTDKPHRLVYFDWVAGNGSYMPFLHSFKYALQKYRPAFRGMDTTSTQKAINELAFENVGIQVDGINFQKDKEAMLNSLSLAVTQQELAWPFIKGLRMQMSSYTRAKDKKMAQDIVMLLAQLAFLARYAPDAASQDNQQTVRDVYRNRKIRTTARRRR